MKKTAVLIDGDFVRRRLKAKLGKEPSADDMLKFASDCIAAQEELFRIYFYHCPAYDGTEIHPITNKKIDFGKSKVAKAGSAFLDAISRKDHVALRKGILSFKGWRLTKEATRSIVLTKRGLNKNDFKPDLEQKGVDIKIGLDVAWLSSKKIVDKIILATGDSDFIPAMKFARREGVQVVLVTLGSHIKSTMREHCDEFRLIAKYQS